jgi:hypothetical protein
MPSLLGLDLSTRAGAAWWPSPAQKPKCWTWKLPKSHDPADYAARTWPLMELIEDFIGIQAAARAPVESIAFESPFIPMAPLKPREGEDAFTTTMHTLRLQIALATTIETVAKKYKIRCVEVSTQTAKKRLVGFGRAPQGQPNFDWKKTMLMAATRAGYSIADDNQADAIAVSLVAFQHLWNIEI